MVRVVVAGEGVTSQYLPQPEILCTPLQAFAANDIVFGFLGASLTLPRVAGTCLAVGTAEAQR